METIHSSRNQPTLFPLFLSDDQRCHQRSLEQPNFPNEIPHQEYALPQNDDMLRREEEEGIGMIQVSAERRAEAEEEVKKAEALLAAAKLKAAETDASVDPIQRFFDQDAQDRALGICRRHVDFAVEQMLFTKRHESR